MIGILAFIRFGTFELGCSKIMEGILAFDGFGKFQPVCVRITIYRNSGFHCVWYV